MRETPHTLHMPELLPPEPPVPDPPREDAGPALEGPSEAAAAAGEKEGGKGKKEKGKKKKEKEKLRPGRGVETMFRTSYRMHIDLTALADSKANILISINGLIISVVLAAIGPRIRAEPLLMTPTTLVLLTCLVSISCAILAARPRVRKLERAPVPEAPRDGNLMFFGGFLSLSRDEYEQAVSELIRQPEELYRGMTRDIYALGSVLDRKFRLLRLAYTVFMLGLAAGVLAYLVVFLLLALSGPTASVLGRGVPLA